MKVKMTVSWLGLVLIYLTGQGIDAYHKDVPSVSGSAISFETFSVGFAGGITQLERKYNIENVFPLIFCYDKKPGVYGNKYDCSRYYICEESRSLSMPCPQGTFYDESRHKCDYIINVPECYDL